MGSDDRILALQPLGLAELADRVGVDDLGRLRRQRQRQHLRNVAHARTDEQAADPLVVDLGGVDLDDGGRQASIARDVLTRT